MIKALLILSFITISSCASNTITPERRSALNNIKNDYDQCLVDNAKELVGGSDDVEFLVNHIVSLCDSVLSDSREKLRSVGFTTPYRNGYTAGLRHNAVKTLSSVILRHNAQLNNAQ